MEGWRGEEEKRRGRREERDGTATDDGSAASGWQCAQAVGASAPDTSLSLFLTFFSSCNQPTTSSSSLVSLFLFLFSTVMADIVADISVLTVILTITADMASYFGDILNLAITLPLFGKYCNSMGS